MGTNYYWFEREPCTCCGRSYDRIHIGKSSAGWCFSLRVYPDDGINTIEDWGKRIGKEGTYIEDEYGDMVSGHDLVDIIVDRRWGGDRLSKQWCRENQAEFGPNNLARHKIDGHHCIGHGDGTWDYIIGEFS